MESNPETASMDSYLPDLNLRLKELLTLDKQLMAPPSKV